MASYPTIGCISRAAFLAAIVPGSAHAQAPAKWRFEPIATIEGVSDAEPFSRIRNIALHADGRLVVVDEKVKQVSMYDASGKSLGVVGRNGGGPGEYRQPYATAWLADTLAIYDPAEARVVFMANGKTPLRTELTRALTGGYDIRFFPVSRAKAYLRQVKRAGNKAESVFIGFGGGGQDTVLPPPQLPTASSTTCKMANGGITGFSWPEAPQNFAVPARPDGALAMGNTGALKIAIQMGERVVAKIERKDLTPRPLEDFYWEQELAGYRAHIAKYGAASCDATPVRPPHIAPIRNVTVADNGDIWIAVDAKDEMMYNIFSPNGQLRATVPIPTRAVFYIPIAIAGDRLAYVTEDVDGVQSVKTLRIVK